MHYGDKVGQSTTGILVRYRRNVELNPFPAGMSLIKTAHKVSTLFIYSNCLGIIHVISQSMGVAHIRI